MCGDISFLQVNIRGTSRDQWLRGLDLTVERGLSGGSEYIYKSLPLWKTLVLDTSKHKTCLTRRKSWPQRGYYQQIFLLTRSIPMSTPYTLNRTRKKGNALDQWESMEPEGYHINPPPRRYLIFI